MILVSLILAGLLGVFAHWYNRWFQGRTQVKFLDYMLKENISATIYSVGMIIGTEITFFNSLPQDTILFSGAFAQVLWSQITSAYLIDSVFNRGLNSEKVSRSTEELKNELNRIKESDQSIDELNKYLEEQKND